MLQQPAQQKPTTDYSQCVSWLGSIYCDTLLYFIPLFFLLLFLPSSSPPFPLHSPPPFLHLPVPSSDAFLVLRGIQKGKNKALSYMFCRFTYNVCIAVRVYLCCASGADCALYVCQLFVYLSVCSRKFKN